MKLKALISLVFCIVLAVLLNSKIGDLPPLGKFLNPFTGFWKNAESIRTPEDDVLRLNGLKETVSIQYDDQHIPHIFAQNDYDLYYAQGFITAKDRLWQMDFQTRYASGRLAEVVGEKAIPLDRYQRRMGMVYGAEKMLEESFKDSISRLILQAYADGVNAYIESLSPKDYPLEFKLLDYKPEPWKPINSALLLKLMSATLAGGSNELFMTNILHTYGKEITDDLFPNYPKREDPIIPINTPWDFEAVASPLTPRTDKLAKPSQTSSLGSTALPHNTALLDGNTLVAGEKEEGLGSNNWAISGKKSSTGKPILANDPHLSLTLPSIWYQIQLHSNQTNSCGVSIPGAPCIIIGFNEQIAWGVTNVGSDVLDWYRITFKEDKPDFYRYENKWIATEQKIEKIAVRGGKSVYDTVYYTQHGPVTKLGFQQAPDNSLGANVPENAALKWVAHLPSNDLRTFYELNRANNYDDYRKALTYFTAPAQNFVYADNQNHIAITPNGYFPLKWKEQGKFILDGSQAENDWQGRIPVEQNPTVKDPPREFVSSANQWPVAATYPYYLHWEFAPYDRGHRINEKLSQLQLATVDSLRLLQLDNRSVLADELLDTLIHLLRTDIPLKPPYQNCLELLKSWNHCYEDHSISATIFDTWFGNIEKELWSGTFNGKDVPMRFPNRDRTVQLLLDEPSSKWYSATKEDYQKKRSEMAQRSFLATIDELSKRYGAVGTSWQWGTVHLRNVPHLAGIGGLGSDNFTINGSGKTVNAIREKSGPSWRMVVALGNRPKAYGILPGGTSGNPGSKFYDNQLPDWLEGQLKELIFLPNAKRNNKSIIYQLTLSRKP